MISWLKKKILEVKQTVSPIYPLRLTKEELTKIFYEQQVCPDCGVWDFREGPSGGMSVNIYCANCGSWFNEQGPFGIDRIFKLGENFDWREHAIDDHRKNYTHYTWKILKTWYRVEFENDTSLERRALHEAVEDCSFEDIIEHRWAVKDYTLYFEEEIDAVAVKLKWI